jgi:peptidoglycan/xylan/chitin deacetylase (PgdA/CDA1 family)
VEDAGKVAGWQNGSGPVVTLTFDDGPSKTFTPQLLRVLAKQGVKAAFFVLGQRLQDGGVPIMKSAFNAGHQIGNHSFNHPLLTKLSEAEIADQLKKTHDLIADCASPKKYFRPPYGATNAHVKAVAMRGGYTTILWDDDTLDWQDRDPSWMATGLRLIKARGRTIVLNHDIHKSTVDNIDGFIDSIRKRFPNVTFLPLG